MKRKIIDITFEEFNKLNLFGYARKWFEYPDKTKRLQWEKVNLNDEIQKNYDLKEYKNKYMIVAIHKNSSLAEKYEQIFEKHYGKNLKQDTNRPELPEGFYYCDKWLNHFGATTFLISGPTEKLYTDNPRKYYITEDYFDISKEETEKVYRIKF